MKKSQLFVVVSMILISFTGCTNKNKVFDLYDKLSAEETYEKSQEYFNENVQYSKSKMERVNKELDICDQSGAKCISFKNYVHSRFIREMVKGDNYQIIDYGHIGVAPISEKELIKENVFFQVYSYNSAYSIISRNSKEKFENSRSDSLIESMNLANPKHVFFSSSLLQDKDIKIMEIKREDTEDEIMIKLRAEYVDSANKSMVASNYFDMTRIIDKNGLIYKNVWRYYKNDEYETVIAEVTENLLDINKKQSLNIDNQIQALKQMEGEESSCINYLFE